MGPVLYLAFRHLRHHRVRSLLLLMALTLTLAVPPVYRGLIRGAFEAWEVRGEQIPLVIGRRGSPVDLLLAAMAFHAESGSVLPYSEFERVRSWDLGVAVPLHVGHRVNGFAVVGTNPDYFRLRGLVHASGRGVAVTGECVLGAQVARQLGRKAGDQVLSDPHGLFGSQSQLPIRMQVAGILQATGGPDDSAVFTDLHTAWMMDGLGHVHLPEQLHEALEAVDFHEVTDETRPFLHFHGNQSEYPISMILARPTDEKSRALWLGRYVDAQGAYQALRISSELDRLMHRIFRVEAILKPAGGLVLAGSLMTALLVFWLSMNLRRKEVLTLEHLGVSVSRIRRLLLAESACILLAALVCAGLAAMAVERLGSGWVIRLMQ